MNSKHYYAYFSDSIATSLPFWGSGRWISGINMDAEHLRDTWICRMSGCDICASLLQSNLSTDIKEKDWSRYLRLTSEALRMSFCMTMCRALVPLIFIFSCWSSVCAWSSSTNFFCVSVSSNTAGAAVDVGMEGAGATWVSPGDTATAKQPRLLEYRHHIRERGEKSWMKTYWMRIPQFEESWDPLKRPQPCSVLNLMN